MSRIPPRRVSTDAATITYHTDEITPVPGVAAVFNDTVDIKTTPRALYQFRDLAEFTARIPMNKPDHALADAAWRVGNKDWSGTDTLDEAVTLAADGWHDGATQAQDAAQRLEIARPTKNRMSRQCAIGGAVPDVARAIAGNPAHMRQIKPREVSGRIVTLVVDIAASSFVSGYRLLLNAVCAAGVVDALEAAGFRVELVARAVMGRNVVADVAIVAKRSDEPLDLGKVAFMCGHPSMLRRFMFGLEAIEAPLRGVGANLGYPCYSTPDADRGLFVVPPPQQNKQHSTDVGDIFEGVVSALREQGCPGLAE